ADLTTTRLVKGMNGPVTYVNALTSLTPNGAKIPIYFDSDRECVLRALETLGLPDSSQARVVRMEDTLSLERLHVSEALLNEIANRRDLESKGDLAPMRFEGSGNLAPF